MLFATCIISRTLPLILIDLAADKDALCSRATNPAARLLKKQPPVPRVRPHRPFGARRADGLRSHDVTGGFEWCARRDSNPHDFTHCHLKAARLPIPPRALLP